MTAVAAPVRERPILFSGEMVRAILDGRKTQTRRVIKPQPGRHDVGAWCTVSSTEPAERGSWRWRLRDFDAIATAGAPLGDPFRCPHGQPGDRLWVRERWGVVNDKYHRIAYGADFGRGSGTLAADLEGQRWRPSIHMPRCASRLTVELTGVRVERLQDISGRDCEAEGVRPASDGDAHDWRADETGWVRTYRQLWDSLNAERGYGWDVNPWVWVLVFQRAGGAS